MNKGRDCAGRCFLPDLAVLLVNYVLNTSRDRHSVVPVYRPSPGEVVTSGGLSATLRRDS